MKSRMLFAGILALLCGHADAIGQFSLGNGAGNGGGSPPPSGQVTSFTVFNSSGSTISNEPVTLEIPFNIGDVPTGDKIQIRESDNSTVVTTQEDECSLWLQDSSRKACSVAIIEPDSITSGSSATYYVWAVNGSPDTTANTTAADIAANLDIRLKVSDLTEAQGTVETGTWDFIGLSYVLGNCPEYDPSTGYGSNPVCGWDIYGSGPNFLGIHAFSYAIRESDSAVQYWIRTDLWIKATGSGSTPCPCSMATSTVQGNTFGKISSGTVGSSPQGGYVYTAILYNGATAVHPYGGSTDARVTNLTSAAFNTSGSIISITAGNWIDTSSLNNNLGNGQGNFPVKITSTSSLPSGLSSSNVYWIVGNGTSGQYILYNNQCSAGGNCSPSQATFTTSGSGTITITPLDATAPFGGWMGLDSTGKRIWVDATGVVTGPPPILVGQEFGYLTQKSKAVPPYIQGLTLLAYKDPITGNTAPSTYYPGGMLFPWDMDTTGEPAGDNRISPIDHTGAYTLFSPADPVAAQTSLVLAAGFARQHMFHFDETTGQPVVLNNTSYATLGTPQPSNRTYPYVTGGWLSPSTNDADLDSINADAQPWMDPSHLPDPMQAPLLKTGEPEWEMLQVQEAISVLGGQYQTSETPSSTTYYRPLAADWGGQTRGWAWGTRVLGQTNEFMPASSPLSQYVRDLLADNANFLTDYMVNGTTANMQALGIYWGDLQNAPGNFTDVSYQPWEDDYAFSMNAWEAQRAEYSAFGTFLTTYYYKNVIVRADAGSGVLGGGCMWGAPARYITPFAPKAISGITYNSGTGDTVFTTSSAHNLMSGSVFNTAQITGITGLNLQIGGSAYTANTASGMTIDATSAMGLSGSSPSGGYVGGTADANLVSTWNDIYSASNTMEYGTEGWPMSPWGSCPSDFIVDDGPSASAPSSLATDFTMSLGWAAWLSIANAGSLYATARGFQYNDYSPALDFVNYDGGGVSYPEWAIGPLGATN